MKKLICLCMILMLTFTIAGCEENKPIQEKGAPVLAAFTATDLAGNSVNESIFAGKKLTMVNIWATFCGPCIAEMPELAELNRSYGEDFQVIGIVIDAGDRNGNPIPQQYADAFAIIGQTGADYRHLLPSPSLNKAYLEKVQAVPETIFVDETGHQVGQSYVGAKSLDSWKAIIAELMTTIPS